MRVAVVPKRLGFEPGCSRVPAIRGFERTAAKCAASHGCGPVVTLDAESTGSNARQARLCAGRADSREMPGTQISLAC